MVVASGSDVAGLGGILAASAQRAPWGWALLATVLLALYRGWPVIGKLYHERESGLMAQRAADMDDMRERIRMLEGRIDKSDRRHEAHIDILSQLHSAEIALMRHRLGLEAQINVGLMAAIRAGNPERLERVAELLETDRARREGEIALELAELVKLRVSAMDKIEKLRAEG